MIDRNNIRIGTSVRASDGESLGEVIELHDSCFVIEKGLIFPKDYIIDYDGVDRFDGDKIVVNYTLDEIKHGFAHSDSSYNSNLGSNSSASGMSGLGTNTDLGLGMTNTTGFSDPNLRDNNLNTRDDNTIGRSGRGLFSNASDDTDRTYGIDRTTDTDKNPSTFGSEKKINTSIDGKEEIRIPVREEIVVEHVPVSDTRMDACEVGMDLNEDSIEVPLYEERVEIGKRAVLKEEVVLKKKKVEGASAQSAQVRKERVVVDRSDENKSDNLSTDSNRSIDRDKAS